MTTMQDVIRQRAREIWERAGRPEGRDLEHWLQAESELRRESLKDQAGLNAPSAGHSLLALPTPEPSNGADKLATNRKREGRRKATSVPQGSL